MAMSMSSNYYCEDCDHHIPTKDPRFDLCVKHPRLDGYGYVRKGTWDNRPPYLYCRDVNGGACPLYAPKADAAVAQLASRR